MNNIEQIIADLGLEAGDGSGNIEFFEYNGLTYFAASDGQTGRELWASDGTIEGTQQVADINPGGSGSFPQNFIEYQDVLYFAARNVETGFELWSSDGTTEGTQLVADINSGFNDYTGDVVAKSSFPGNFKIVGDQLFFTASAPEPDNAVTFTTGASENLFVTDGTTEGTIILTNFEPAEYPTDILDIVEFNNTLYFSVDEEFASNSEGLWVSDGTVEGTRRAVNFDDGDFGAAPQELTIFNDRLYFTAFTPETGRELWVSDGTQAGTSVVTDLVSGFNYSVSDLAVEEDRLLFTAFDDNSNSEQRYQLFIDGTVSLVDPNPPTTIEGTFESEEISGTDADEIINGRSGNDRLNGVGGDDILNGEFDDDILDGGVGNDTLSGGDGFDVFVLGADSGSDTITDFVPRQDSFSLSGGLSFDDLTLTGNQINLGDTLIATVEGVDTSSLSASDFNQPASEGTNNEGTLGADTIEGTDSVDRIKGFAGDDVINALDGFDLVFGDAGNDELDGGNGNDTIYGGSGNDTINGGVGFGNDTLVGQGGNDSFVIADNVGADLITDFNPGEDNFILSGDLSFEDLTLNGNQIVIDALLVATVEGIEDLNSLPSSDFKEEEPTPEETLIEGTLDADTIDGTDSGERIKGFAGNDVINAFGGDDTIFGDVGDDELDGGSGDDTVVGSVGNDTISGGAGNDVLVGEGGNDFFVLTSNEGTDTITDFNLQSDLLMLGGGLVFEDLSFNNNSILVGDETLAILEGVDTAQLQADSFV